MKFIFFFFFVLLHHIAIAQTITTFAGSGSNVYSGDSVPATNAGIPSPGGGAFDKFGNYYFVDAYSSHRVRKIDPLGIISTVAGNGTGAFGGDGGAATNAKLYLPQNIALDTVGNIYISDAGNNRIRKVTIATGIIITVAGTGAGTFSGDNGPATAANIWDPNDICFDKFGNIYIADLFNYRIRKINSAGIITTFAGSGTMGYPTDNVAATSSDLDYPIGLASDDTGNIYIADNGSFSSRVRKVNTAGVITTVAGNGTSAYSSDGILATTAAINPGRLAFDTSGELYIADQYNNRVYKVDNGGVLHTISGNGTAGDAGDAGAATSAELCKPSGLAFDPCGNLYIPTPGSPTTPGTGKCIRKIAFNPPCALPELQVTATQELVEFSIFPNPAFTLLDITASTLINNISITNLIGKEVFTQSCNTYKIKINVANLPPGVYLLRATDADGNVTIKKLVKE